MESNYRVQPNEVPNTPHPACFHHHPLHCFHGHHYHWLYPPFLCGHAPISTCPCPSASSPAAISHKIDGPLPAHKLPNGSSAQSTATNTVSGKQENTSAASIGCECACSAAVHMHTPLCPHHYRVPCRAHGGWQSPCMMPPFPPIPWRPLPIHPHLNIVEAFSGHGEGEPTADHIGAEIWHREGESQANQDGAVEDAYELEEEEEEPVFVLTDEWMEFFAKSEARRQQKKKQQQKEAKKLRKAARSAPKKHDGEVEISDSAAHASADASSSALS